MNILYFVECSYGKLGRAFRETDRDSNSRKEIIGLIRTGEITPVKILEIDEESNSCRDVTQDIMAEVEALAYGHAMVSATDLVMSALDRSADYRKHGETVA